MTREGVAASGRRWTHRDLVEGRCTVEEYVSDLKADVDARMAENRDARVERQHRALEARASLNRARRLLRMLTW